MYLCINFDFCGFEKLCICTDLNLQDTQLLHTTELSIDL